MKNIIRVSVLATELNTYLYLILHLVLIATFFIILKGCDDTKDSDATQDLKNWIIHSDYMTTEGASISFQSLVEDYHEDFNNIDYKYRVIAYRTLTRMHLWEDDYNSSYNYLKEVIKSCPVDEISDFDMGLAIYLSVMSGAAEIDDSILAICDNKYGEIAPGIERLFISNNIDDAQAIIQQLKETGSLPSILEAWLFATSAEIYLMNGQILDADENVSLSIGIFNTYLPSVIESRYAPFIYLIYRALHIGVESEADTESGLAVADGLLDYFEGWNFSYLLQAEANVLAIKDELKNRLGASE